MRRSALWTALVAVVVAVLTACGSSTPWEGTGLDAAGWDACSSLASSIRGTGGGYGLEPGNRVELARGVQETAPRSSAPGVAGAASYVERAATGPDGSWRASLDGLAERCQTLGWHG